MKTTGIVRRVDELGRFVIPKELRKMLHMDCKDFVEINVEGDCIILKSFQPFCIFCGSVEAVSQFKEKTICAACLEEIKSEK